MKKLVLIVTVLFLCVNLSSCGIWEELSYAISGEILEPVDGFSRGSENGTLIFCGNKYILIDELNGDFQFYITKEDILLGLSSNFIFFPPSSYYATTKENPDYIAGGNTVGFASFVFLREDLHQSRLYVLEHTDCEFDFSSAFVETKAVSYERHVKRGRNESTELCFSVKDYPRLTAKINIYKIREKWYYIEQDGAYALSEDFLSALKENGCLPK